MMRAAVLLAGFLSVSANNQANCAINGARAVDDLLDSAVFIWAATKRCNTKLPNTEQDPIRCSLNIASSVESVNAMVNVILKAVEECGGLETHHHKCGLAVGVLTRAFAGLAASSSGIIAKCPNKLNNNKPLITYGGPSGTLANVGMQAQSSIGSATNTVSAGMGQCIINMKDTLKSLFKSIKRIMTIRFDCDPDRHGHHHCAHNALKLVAGLSSIGEYLAGSIGKCTTNAALAVNAQCAQESLELVQHLHNVGRASVELNKHCGADAARLYDLDGVNMASSNSNSFTFTLAAFIPVAAVLGFVGGNRFYKVTGRTVVPMDDAEE